MARDKALWAKIRADFLATGKSYPELAKEYGVSISTLKKKAAKEAWAADKGQIDSAVAAGAGAKKRNRRKEPEPRSMEPEPIPGVPTDEEIANARHERVDKFFEITDAMMDRIYEAIMRPDVISPYALKQLASSLRDLREMQGLNRTELDIEEQQAKIAKLRSETRVVEEGGDNGVIILPPMDARPTPPGEDNA